MGEFIHKLTPLLATAERKSDRKVRGMWKWGDSVLEERGRGGVNDHMTREWWGSL
jgi:hypothetical protein